MSDRGPEPDGAPPSIAAIMAAIRDEVTATRAPVADRPDDVPADPSPADPAPTEPPPADPGRAPLPPVPPAAGIAVPGRPPTLPPGLDAEVRALLAPLLREWLDAHLPEIVEAATRAEIRRLTGLAD